MGATPSRQLTVVGSLNLDVICRCATLPAPGETITATDLTRSAGGKGANQAVAAARLGGQVSMIGAVGDDEAGPRMREALRSVGIDDTRVRTVAGPTGTALIAVDARGENQIIVVPGANGALRLTAGELDAAPTVLCQLETPMDTVLAAAHASSGYFALNAAPAAPLPAQLRDRCDLIIVNDAEYATLDGLTEATAVAVTHGADGADLRERGRIVATATAPDVSAVDSVGAGDAFCAALVLALRCGLPARRALQIGCQAGAHAVAAPGAQPPLPHLSSLLTAAESRAIDELA